MKLSSIWRMVVFTIVLLTLSFLLGCNSTGSGTKKLKVGWSIDTITTPFNAAEDKAVKEGWAKYPEVELYSTDAQAQSIKQVSDIEDLVSKGINLLMVKPRDEKTLTEVLKRVRSKGIPVVTIDRYVEGDAATTFVGSDNFEVGRVVAQAMAKLLNYKGNVGLIEGTPGASSYMDRTEAFKEEMKKYPNIKIIASQPCLAKRDEGKKLTENWLQAYGKSLNAIHSNTDEITMGVVQVLKEAKRKDVIITSVNAQMELVKEIAEGNVNMTAAYSTGVHPGIELAWLMLHGEKDIPKKIIVPTVYIGPEEAKKYYNPNVYIFDFIPGGSPAYKEAEKQYPILNKLKPRL